MNNPLLSIPSFSNFSANELTSLNSSSSSSESSKLTFQIASLVRNINLECLLKSLKDSLPPFLIQAISLLRVSDLFRKKFFVSIIMSAA